MASIQTAIFDLKTENPIKVLVKWMFDDAIQDVDENNA